MFVSLIMYGVRVSISLIVCMACVYQQRDIYISIAKLSCISVQLLDFAISTAREVLLVFDELEPLRTRDADFNVHEFAMHALRVCPLIYLI